MSGEIAFLRPGGQALRGSEAIADRLRDLDSAGALVADAQGRLGLAPNPLAPPEGQRVLCYYPPLPPERLGAPGFRREFGARFAVTAPASDLALAQAFGDFGALASVIPPTRPQEAEMTLARAHRAFGGRLFALRVRRDSARPEAAEAMAELWARRGGRLLEAEGFEAPSLALTLWRAETLSRDAEGTAVSPRRLIARVSDPASAEAFLRPAPRHLLDQLLARGQIDAERRDLALRLPMADAVIAAGGSGAWPTLPLLARVLRLRETLCGPQDWPLVGAAGGAGSPQALAALFAMGADHLALDEAALVLEKTQRLGGGAFLHGLDETAEEFRGWSDSVGLDLGGPPQEALGRLLRAAAFEARLSWLALSGAPMPPLTPPRPSWRPPA